MPFAYSLEYIFFPTIMRDRDNLSNNIAQSKHSETIKNELNIAQRMADSSKAKNGALFFVATVNTKTFSFSDTILLRTNLSIFYEFCRISTNYRPCFYILEHSSTSSNHGSFADCDSHTNV